jgi:arylsulfatase A-like enzyme
VLDDGYKDDAVEKLGTHKPAGPFRGGKYSTFEGGTRMPFLVRWTGRVKPGTTTDAIISQVDFPATFAALAGTSFPKERAPDTRNLLPALLGETKTGRDHVLEHSGNVAVRAGDWKLIPGKAKKKADPVWQLFNLSKDPGESTDIAAENPGKVEELRRLLPTAEASSPFHR